MESGKVFFVAHLDLLLDAEIGGPWRMQNFHQSIYKVNHRTDISF